MPGKLNKRELKATMDRPSNSIQSQVSHLVNIFLSCPLSGIFVHLFYRFQARFAHQSVHTARKKNKFLAVDAGRSNIKRA